MSLKLETLIRSKTLPKTVFSISLITIALLVGLLYFSNYQTEIRHANYLNKFQNHLETRITSLQTELANLAQNGLIVNSLIDFDFLERSLPVFLNSLKLSIAPIEIGFTNFKGELVTSNSKLLEENALKFPDWKDMVFKNAQSYLRFDQGTIFVGEPILYANMPEGALIAYVNNFSTLLGTLPSHTNDIIVLDKQNQILFSTRPEKFPLNQHISSVSFQGYYTKRQPFLEWTLISAEPLWQSYQELFPLVIFLLICIAAVLLTTFATVRLASSLAAKSVHELQHKIQITAQNNFLNTNALNNSHEIAQDTNPEISNIDEFADIQNNFADLLTELENAAMSRNTLAGVVDSLDEVMLVLDLDSQVILQNRRLETLLLDLDIVLPKDINKLIPESLIQSDHLGESHEIIYSQNAFPSLNRSIVFKWQRHLFKNENGEHLGFTLSGNDISIEKAIEAELLLKNKAMDESANSIIISEASGSGFPITYVNRAFEKLTGYSKEAILGLECKFLQGEKTEAHKLHQIREALMHAKPLSVTLTNYRKDGSEFQNQLTLSPIFNSEGQLTHVIGLQEDVSERERSNQLIREAQQKAEESARLKSDFLASMSHEIRTPMNGVLGMLNILKETELKPTQEQQVALAQQSAQSLLVIINDILDFSKIEAGKLLLEPIEFDLFTEVNNLVQSQATAAHNKGIDIIVDMTALESPYLIGDPTRIKQIITNLLSNAIKFTEQGSIKLIIGSEASSFDSSSEKKATRLNVSVIDQGIGIPANRLDNIFDTFTQADSSTTRKFGGTGLGLSISRQICKLMDGDITVKSQEGIGSEFSFTLALESSPKVFTPPPEYVDKSVLILESNPSTAQVITTQLQQWNAEVFVFDSMSHLLSALETNRTCLIFVDEESLNHLSNDIFIQAKSKLEALNASMIVVSSREFQPYVNKSLFGEHPKHTIKHLIKPITTKQLFDLVAQSSENDKQSGAKQSQGSNLLSGKQILLVEDNNINQIVASTLLESLGAEISIANHGKEAINLLQAKTGLFDLVLMDCQMPEMDGYEASKCIREGKAGDHYKNIPIIALTANALKGDREKCLAAGMNDYISKPIDIKDLKKALKKNLFKKSEQTQPKNANNPQSENVLETIDSLNKEPESVISFDDFEIWNEAEMLHRIANNRNLGKQLVEVFSLDVEDIYQDLKTAFEEADLNKLGFTAHTLKGVASNISGIRLAKLCAKIEADAKGNFSGHISQYMDLLYPMISDLRKKLEKRISEWD